MKFGQLIEFNIRKVFLKKSYGKCGGEARPFYEKSQFSISLDQQSEILESLFLMYAQVEVLLIDQLSHYLLIAS